MKIGILGAGSIGSALARKLSAAGHDIQIANSRGPHTIDPGIVASGARAVEATDVITGIEALVISVPLSSVPAIKALIADLPDEVAVIDTSNYYPLRDGQIQALDDGQVESVWVTEQLGRPVAKAWNAILAGSLETKGTEAATPGRVAIPVAGDREVDKAVAMTLVEATGFDAVDAGSLGDSWRQQPGAPAYCTDLTRQELAAALRAARKDRVPQRRDVAMATITEKIEGGATLTSDDLVELNRSTYN
ncbi:NADP oxidoreductase [Arthrobacter sp. AFG7.2]|uniref:NADPH-dependent F420 reductase n=1 Tax=Arthrobacter sp. AFG7.2 TaxID=1688693 RepID=UPI000C9E94CF|nr:NAD(P)-binding domain-containing protein [Arthrobacter sp. AFG7.2]PNI07330.1 NADP oxidoreductase [Arthrobacter sp. AFG7.2]